MLDVTYTSVQHAVFPESFFSSENIWKLTALQTNAVSDHTRELHMRHLRMSQQNSFIITRRCSFMTYWMLAV